VSVDWLGRAVPWLRQLAPYLPGKPEEELLAERGITDGAKLASNENPFGAPPAAIAAAKQALGRVHRYPDGAARALKEKLAQRLRVSPAQILLGNGSNEVIELVIRAFAGPGDEVLAPARAFIVYRLAATAAGARFVGVPERDGLRCDLDALAARIGPKTKVVCLANPNNPTGAWHEPAAIAAFLAGIPEDVIVLLDEAYWEYVVEERPEVAEEVLSHPGLVRTRTFSKAWGLAGLRIGYAFADAAIVSLIERMREPFNTNRVAQAAAAAALEEEDWMRRHVRIVISERKRLEEALAERGLLGAPSWGNFVLMRLASEAQMRRFVEGLEVRGVIPRPLGPYGMNEWLRITVGTPEENARFLAAVDEILEEGD